MRLRALAPAKVNLSLFLGGTRAEDRRHRLVTVFESLSLADTLELELIEGTRDQVVCPGVEGENLAARALAGLRARGWDGPRVRITIDKRIPVAAGMAGGSADAAAALRLAMALAGGRDRIAEEVDRIAAQLGADVPSQLLSGVALGTGAGEIVEHLAPLAEHAFVVLPSEFSLATPDVFREADRLELPRSDAELEALYGELVAALAPDVGLPARLLVNDLEAAAVSLCPWCGEALEAMRAAGAEHALVSGSGPTVVGIWWGLGAVGRAFAAAQELRVRYPLALAAEPVSAEYAAASLT
jgi:4-diphosphocytidyl-2-C-methyl-D-erythritol kinase